MTRPRKYRHVCCMPENTSFGPLNKTCRRQNAITITVDEYEAIRLIDFEGLDQTQCAEKMAVARSTVQSIYQSARKKIAEAIISGNRFEISGGDYRLYNEAGSTEPCCHGHRKYNCQCHYESKLSDKNIKENTMKTIILTADTQNPEEEISQSFGRCTFYAIYNLESKEITFVKNEAATSPSGAGIKAAQFIVNQQPQALIAIKYGENALQVLNGSEVKVYQAISGSITANIEAYIQAKLELAGK